MSASMLDLLSKVTLLDFLWALCLIVAIVLLIVSQKQKLSDWLNNWREHKNKKENFQQLVYNLQDSVSDLKITMNQYQKNREHDRADSRKIRDEMYQVINEQSQGIRNLTEIIVSMQEKNSKTKRAEIKEKIERIYRECHPSMTCTDMALETLKELIEEYEAHGGLNSFVHSTVEPEMIEWKIIKQIKN